MRNVRFYKRAEIIALIKVDNHNFIVSLHKVKFSALLINILINGTNLIRIKISKILLIWLHIWNKYPKNNSKDGEN